MLDERPAFVNKVNHETWEAVHFGIRQRLSSETIEMEKPFMFVDKMTKGAFKSMHHKHIFEEQDGKIIMTDIFKYEVPFGVFGKMFNKLVLESYMTKFLKTRNEVLKNIAEEPASNLG